MLEKIKPLKTLGQNFLHDKNLANKIVDLLGEIGNRNVIEIGPGMGALTDILINRKANVFAFDKDERAINYLEEKHKLIGSLQLVLADIRSINLGDFLVEHNINSSEKISVIGNIPYNISTDILFWLFEHSTQIDKAILTIQKEVAERLVAKPKTKDYGVTTVAMQLFAHAKIAFHIPGTAFFPQPKVTSSVILINFNISPKYDNAYKKKLMKFVRAAFSQRRKMLSNSMKNYFGSNSIDVLALSNKLTEQNKRYLSQRAEELTIDDFIDFYDITTLFVNKNS